MIIFKGMLLISGTIKEHPGVNVPTLSTIASHQSDTAFSSEPLSLGKGGKGKRKRKGKKEKS